MLRVLEVALAEVGYTESAGNVTKYAAELDKLDGFYNGPKNGYAWCDVFVDWCMYKAYGRELAQRLLCQPNDSAGAGCTYSAQYYQRAGRWSTVPQVGAQIFFGSASESTHTGLVYAVDNNFVYTVEGNTSDGVYKRSYPLHAGNIYGYGLPDYTLAESSQSTHDGEDDEIVYITPSSPTATIETCTVTLPVLRAGAEGGAVAAMQAVLLQRGFSVGPDGADGDFGENTGDALEAFQRDRGLDPDRICGVQSWPRLIGG